MGQVRQLAIILASLLVLHSCAPPTGDPQVTSFPTADEAPSRPRPEDLSEIFKPPQGIVPTRVVYSQVDVQCGDKTYTIKTGTRGGWCEVFKIAEQTIGLCSHKGRGATMMTCDEGCKYSTGAGVCLIKH